MQQHEIHDYIEYFFRYNDCEILQKTPTYLEIQLTIEMDKKLMNRPFYWH
ncbi:YqhG family protein, partial [Gottfriedia acidiceleris]